MAFDPSEALLDTDIFSEVFKAVDPQVPWRARAYAEDHPQLLFTSVTAMEVLRGLHRKSATAQIVRAERIFALNQEIVPQVGDYRLASEIIGALERQGRPIGVSDPLIAACAINRGLVLATGNARHFGYVQVAGFPLRFEDWRQD